MAPVTGTTADKFIDEVWSAELNRAITFALIIAALFSDWTSRMKGSGDIYHLVNRHNLATNSKSAGVDATPEAITETEQTFTVATHQIVAQEIEDFAEVMSKYDIRAEYTLAASYSLGRSMDVACAALLDDNTGQSVGFLTAELTDDNFIRAWQYLQDSSGMAPYKGLVSPAAWGGMLKIEKFTQQLFNGDTQGRALHDAQIGRVYQATMFATNLLVGTAPNASGHIWAGDHFFKIIKKAPKQDTWFSPLAKAWIVATDQIYGVFEKEEADEAESVTTSAKLHGVRLQTLK